MEVRSKCQNLKAQISSAANTTNEMAALSQALKEVGALIDDGGDRYIEQQLLSYVTSYCEHERLELIDYPKPYLHLQNGYGVETKKIEVKGTFKKIVGLVYGLEQESKSGTVVSVHYVSKKNLRSKRYELSATLYLQNLKSTKREV